ncbi:MAG: PEP-CTERM sorting domain-containing protein [Tepidisphaerales bacterium]
MRNALILVAVLAVVLSLGAVGNAAIVWTGAPITFTKADFADPTLAQNQDQLTADVWITRANTQGIFNIAPGQETFYTHGVSPAGTQWAYGSAANWASLTFKPWETWVGNDPPATIGKPAVLHLVADNIYLDITFLSWNTGHTTGGGGFSYVRSTPGVTQPVPMLVLGPQAASAPPGLTTATTGLASGDGAAVTLNLGSSLMKGSVVLSPITLTNAGTGSATLAYVANNNSGAFSLTGSLNNPWAPGATGSVTLASNTAGLGYGAVVFGSVKIQDGTSQDETINVTGTIAGPVAAGVAVKSPPIPASGSYAGLSSKLAPGAGTTSVGTEAVIRSGTDNNNAGKQVTETWSGIASDSHAVTPIGGLAVHLVSDIVNLQNTDGDKIVLQMSYAPDLFPGSTPAARAAAELDAAKHGLIQIFSLNAGNVWVPSISLDHGTNAGAGPQLSSWDLADPTARLQLGAWGVDTSAHVAWAVVDHNSSFVVVPEPARLALLGVGAIGLVARRRRQGGWSC